MIKNKALVNLQAIIVVLGVVFLTGCSGSGDDGSNNDSLEGGNSETDDINTSGQTETNTTDNNPDTFEPTDTEVLAAAVNTPDVQGSAEYYPNSNSAALLTGPLIGLNSGSENIFSRSIPFNQVATDRPIRVQRVVATNYIDDRGDERFMVIFTVRNISSSLVCGDTFNFDLLRADGTKGGISSSSDVGETWHGERVGYVIENRVIRLTGTYSSCIQPNSSIYITRRILSSMAPDELDRVDIRRPSFHDLESSSSETVSIIIGASMVVPTSYTVGSLPESDSRVRTGADDEFVKVTVVNNGTTVQNLRLSYMFMMDSSGYPVARILSISANFSALQDDPIEPGAEQELIFRNSFDVGDVSSVRVIASATPVVVEE